MNLYEDAKQDMEYRQSAKMIVDTLYREIKNNGYTNFSKRTTKRGTVYTISSIALGLSSNMYVFFAIHDYSHQSGQHNINAAIDSNNRIHVFYDFQNNIDLHHNRDLRDTLIHEVIHLFDNVRSGHKIPSSSDAYKTDGYEGYANSDSEMNAYYQEMVSMVDDKIDEFKQHRNYAKMYELLLNTPEKFIKFVLGRLDSTYWGALTPKNKQQFKKRIYQYYQEIKEELVP